jgi:hypothetical protein
MNEKPQRLDMGFGEALARLARVPKSAVTDETGKKAGKAKAKPAVVDKKRPIAGK